MSIQVAREGRVLRVALDRPAKKNALDQELCCALVETVETAQNDDRVGAILFESRGDVFCAGMDLDDAAAPDAEHRTAIHARLFTMGSWSRKPLVAAVAGPALGGGVGLLANTHIAVAAQGTSFGLTEIRAGMWPYVVWNSVVRAIGERRAVALALTGRIFSVNEALQWGLLAEVAPAFELDDRVTAIAEHLASSSADAIARGLRFVEAARDRGGEESLALALASRAEAFASAEFREGVSAFRERRKPHWLPPGADSN